MIEDEEGLVDDWVFIIIWGFWVISEIEWFMKVILLFVKLYRFDVEFVDEGSILMDFFEVWKKEYKLFYEYWMVLRNCVFVVDEFVMVIEWLRVCDFRELKFNLFVFYIIELYEVE